MPGYKVTPLQWRHNGRDSVSNRQPHDCLLIRLFRRKSNKTSKPRVTVLCAGNSPVTGEFPAQMASYVENVSIWWRHHALSVKEVTEVTENRALSSRQLCRYWYDWGSRYYNLLCRQCWQGCHADDPCGFHCIHEIFWHSQSMICSPHIGRDRDLFNTVIWLTVL